MIKGAARIIGVIVMARSTEKMSELIRVISLPLLVSVRLFIERFPTLSYRDEIKALRKLTAI